MVMPIYMPVLSDWECLSYSILTVWNSIIEIYFKNLINLRGEEESYFNFHFFD